MVESIKYPQIWSLYGEPSTMKSSYALTFPGKIAYYDWDLGLHGRAFEFEELEASGHVVVRDMQHPMKNMMERHATLEGYYEAWDAFYKDYIKVLSDDEYQTIVFDTASTLWALCRDAYLQMLQQETIKAKKPMRRQLLQIEYATPNQWMAQIIGQAKPSGKNLVILHHSTAEYAPLIQENGKAIVDENGQPRSFDTGKKVADGWGKTSAKCDWILRCRSEGEGSDTTGWVTVEKPAGNIKMLGQEMEWFTYSKFHKFKDMMV